MSDNQSEALAQREESDHYLAARIVEIQQWLSTRGFPSVRKIDITVTMNDRTEFAKHLVKNPGHMAISDEWCAAGCKGHSHDPDS